MPIHVGSGGWRNARPSIGLGGQWRQAQAMWVGSGGQWRQVFADAIDEVPHSLGIQAYPDEQPTYVEGTWVNTRSDLQIQVEWYLDTVAQPLRATPVGAVSARLFEGEWDSPGRLVTFRVRYFSGGVFGEWSPMSSSTFTP